MILSFDVLIPNQLDIVDGENITTTYSYSAGNLTSTVELANNTYTNPITRWYGIWLTAIGGLGFGLALFMFNTNPKGDEY